MYKTRCLWGAVCLLAIFSLVISGCGGGGSSSSSEPPPDDTAMMPDPEPMGPTRSELDAEAMRVAGALGDNAKVTAVLPTGAAPLVMGKVTDNMMPTGFKADAGASYTPLGGNWVSNAYTQTNQAGNVMVEGVLYNNVEDPTAERYAAYFASDSDSDPDFVTSLTDANGMLTFTSNGFSAGNSSDKFMFSGYTADPGTNFDLPNENDPMTPGVDNERVGSFFGIEGKFACGGSAACVARANNQGALVFSGDWSFTPDGYVAGDAADGNTPATGTMVQGVIPDPDYMAFGYWLKKTTARDGTVSYEVHINQDGGSPVTDISAAQGTATYAGPATGIFMKKTVDPNGEPTSPFSSGQFVADAMLTASFGGDTVGTSHQNTVTGTITNFMDSNGASIADWELTLSRSTSSTGGTFAGQTSGYKDSTALGDWDGQFYGTDPAAADDRPGSAAGTFNGHFLNGHVAGAFGATLQK